MSSLNGVSRLPGLITLAAVFILSGCATTLDLQGALTVVPYRLERDGRIVVEATVNGAGPFEFILDSAASISAVFDRLSDQLSLEIIPGQVVKIRGVVASGEFSLMDVGHLTFGTETWESPRVVSLPSDSEAAGDLDGVLGVDFLSRYAVFFSARDRVIRLYPPELVARQAYRGWSSIPLTVRSISKGGPAVYFIDIEIDGHEIPAVFDLGAGVNMINWKGAGRLGVRRPLRGRNEVIIGAIDTMTVLARLDAREVTTAGIRWRNENFAIADLEIFETLMIADRPTAILGATLFTQRDFIIDFQRNRLLVNVGQQELDHATIAAPQ
ncbi:MAG: retropepsin-like aspartic protease [Woeseiaceae bacterium]